MITYERVTKYYDDRDISLRDVSLHIDEGEFVSLVGHSGAGKTTMIRLLLAEENPTEGVVYFDGDDIHALRGHKIPMHRRRIGVVFQDFKLLPSRTAFENIAFSMEVAGRPDDEIAIDVPHMLELVGLAEKSERFPFQLSGGERQRLAIARAIINQPDVIVADEPTGNLDPESTQGIVDLLKKINELGTTVLLATHDSDVLKSLKSRVVRLKDGKIIEDSGSHGHHQKH